MKQSNGMLYRKRRTGEMDMKKLDLRLSVYELTEQYPELIEILEKAGLTEITKKKVLSSVGRIMTLPKGARMKGISMEELEAELNRHGFSVDGTGTTEQIKSYLKRLGEGEDLESVRADFVKDFKEVDAAEIMNAEQELLKEGTPLEEVQKLCDVHSALFHGKTREEQIANAEKAVATSLREQKLAVAAELVAIPGHPLHTLTLENGALEKVIEKCREAVKSGHVESRLLEEVRQLAIHYAKKGDLLYPHLKVKYEITGPSDVMWTVDDEIRDEFAALAKKAASQDEDWLKRLDEALTRADEMIYKEANILFPNCALHFTDEEWYGVYHDSKDYAECFGVENGIWKEAEAAKSRKASSVSDGEIVMAGGHMTIEQLTAMLNTIPLEISFVDADNINRYFNEGPKVFKRPGMAIDREVFSCHPPKIEKQVRRIIEEFRAGTLDRVPVWMDKNGRTMLVTYMAVRDKDGVYLGTMELVQDMEFAKEYFTKK